MFKLTFTGNLYKDAEQAQTPSGKEVTKLYIAVSLPSKSEDEKRTVWVQASCWGNLAKQAAKGQKGNKVIVHGSGREPYGFFNNKTNATSVMLMMDADSVEIIGTTKSNDLPNNGYVRQYTPQAQAKGARSQPEYANAEIVSSGATAGEFIDISGDNDFPF